MQAWPRLTTDEQHAGTSLRPLVAAPLPCSKCGKKAILSHIFVAKMKHLEAPLGSSLNHTYILLSNQDHVGTVADHVEIHACGVDIGSQLVVVPNRVPADCSVVRAATVSAMLVLVFALCLLHVNW